MGKAMPKSKGEVIEVVAIGHVLGGRSEPIDDDWGAVETIIALDPAQFEPEALAALDAFSHLETVEDKRRGQAGRLGRGSSGARGEQISGPRTIAGC